MVCIGLLTLYLYLTIFSWLLALEFGTHSAYHLVVAIAQRAQRGRTALHASHQGIAASPTTPTLQVVLLLAVDAGRAIPAELASAEGSAVLADSPIQIIALLAYRALGRTQAQTAAIDDVGTLGAGARVQVVVGFTRIALEGRTHVARGEPTLTQGTTATVLVVATLAQHTLGTATLTAAREQHLTHLALVVGFEIVMTVAG